MLDTQPQGASMVLDVARRYGIATRSWNVENTLYKSFAAVKINCDEGPVLLKPFVGTVRQIQAVTTMLEELWANGYHHLPRLRRTITGGRFVVLGNDKYYATDWVEGEILDTSEAHLFQLGAVLAKLHQQSVETDGGRVHGASPTQVKVSQLRKYDRRCRHLRVDGGQVTSAQRWYLSHLGEFAAMADDAWARWRDKSVQQMVAEEPRSPSPIHGDVTRFNVIVEPSGGIRLIDWDRARIGSRWFELVNALSNTARFRPKEMSALLRGYESEKPLTATERQLVALLYRLPREAWYAHTRLGTQHVFNKDLITVLEQTWDERIAAVEWMDTWANGGRQAR